MLPVDGGSDYGYNDDVKFNPGPHFPLPQPGYPNSYVAMYQQVPETPEFPIAQTIPLNAQPLPGTHIYCFCSILNTESVHVGSRRVPRLHSSNHLYHFKC